jgi:tetratricopeptide (TPR) repeat protein
MMTFHFRRILLWLLPALVVWGCSGGGRHGTGPQDRVYSHKVEAGETLADIADEYYGDPSRVRTLETFNELQQDAVEPGMMIRIPMNSKDIEHLRVRERAREPYNRGLALAENGSYLDAIQQFQESLSIDPKFIDARYNLGVTLQKMKSYDRALDQFKKVVRERPDVPEYHFARGNSYFYLERYDDAAMAFEDVMKRARNHVKAQYSLAVCYEKMGQKDKAKQAWQRYLEIDSNSVWATEARKRLNNLK